MNSLYINGTKETLKSFTNDELAKWLSVQEVIDLGEFEVRPQYLQNNGYDINDIKSMCDGYDSFAEALAIHDRIASYYPIGGNQEEQINDVHTILIERELNC